MRIASNRFKADGRERGMITAMLLVLLMTAPAVAEEKKEDGNVFSPGKIEATGKSPKNSSARRSWISNHQSTS